MERYEGKNEAMSFRMKKSNHRTTDAWRKSILDGSYKLDFDQDFHGKSLVSTYLVIYEDNKLEKNEKCCIVLDANAPLGTIHILRKHLQGVPSIGTHFRFQFLNFLIVLSQKSNLQF